MVGLHIRHYKADQDVDLRSPGSTCESQDSWVLMLADSQAVELSSWSSWKFLAALSINHLDVRNFQQHFLDP